MGVLESRPYAIGSSIILLLAAALVFLAINPPWMNPGSATAMYSVLAFLTITITTLAHNVRRSDPSLSHDFFVAGTGYASIVFAGAAIFYIITFETVAIHVTTSGIFLNLMAFATTGVILFMYSYFLGVTPSETSRWYGRLLTRGIIAIGTTIFVISMVVSRLPLPDWFFMLFGYIIGGVAITTYLWAAVLMFKRNSTNTFDTRRLGISFALLAVAAFNHVLILPYPSSLWLITIGLMGISFMIAIVAVGYPYLIQLGLPRDFSYAITIVISAIVVLPFLFTYLVESAFLFFVFVDVGATLIIHLCGFFFAVALAYSLFYKSKYHPAPYHSPVILLLVYWSIAEITMAFFTLQSIMVIGAECLIPYILGGIASVVLLSLSVRRMLNPGSVTECYSGRVYVISAFVFAAFLFISEVVYQVIQLSIISEFVGVLSISILLGLTFVSLFVLITFLVLQVGIYGHEFSFDALAAGATAIWLVIMTLKANFVKWSSGWWTAEGLLAVCFVVFPIILVRMYLVENRNAKIFKDRASSYSDYLGGQIQEHNKEVVRHLEKLVMDSGIGPSSRSNLSEALDDLSKTNEIAKSIRTLIASEGFSESEVEPIDLIDSIQHALSRIDAVEQEAPVSLDSNMNLRDCFVNANSLLHEAFYHLFVGAIRRIGVLHSIYVEISPKNKKPKSNWYSTISLELSPADQVEEQDLFSRYTSGMHWRVFEFAYAQRIVSLFGGYIQSGSTSVEGSRFSVHFELILPAAQLPNQIE